MRWKFNAYRHSFKKIRIISMFILKPVETIWHSFKNVTEQFVVYLTPNRQLPFDVHFKIRRDILMFILKRFEIIRRSFKNLSKQFDVHLVKTNRRLPFVSTSMGFERRRVTPRRRRASPGPSCWTLRSAAFDSEDFRGLASNVRPRISTSLVEGDPTEDVSRLPDAENRK